MLVSAACFNVSQAHRSIPGRNNGLRYLRPAHTHQPQHRHSALDVGEQTEGVDLLIARSRGTRQHPTIALPACVTPLPFLSTCEAGEGQGAILVLLAGLIAIGSRSPRLRGRVTGPKVHVLGLPGRKSCWQQNDLTYLLLFILSSCLALCSQ